MGLAAGRQVGPPQLQKVVGQGHRGELSRHLAAAPEQELPEAPGLFELLEVGRAMVLFYPALKRKIFEEGREEGRREGRKEWEAWNERREEALANNQTFDEPPPSRNKDDKA
jgi:hypothetical protein